jgi:hypothetical protein
MSIVASAETTRARGKGSKSHQHQTAGRTVESSSISAISRNTSLEADVLIQLVPQTFPALMESKPGIDFAWCVKLETR